MMSVLRVKRWRGKKNARKKDISKAESDSPKVIDMEESSTDDNLDGNVVVLQEVQQDITSPVENLQIPEGQSHILNLFVEISRFLGKLENAVDLIGNEEIRKVLCTSIACVASISMGFSNLAEDVQGKDSLSSMNKKEDMIFDQTLCAVVIIESCTAKTWTTRRSIMLRA